MMSFTFHMTLCAISSSVTDGLFLISSITAVTDERSSSRISIFSIMPHESIIRQMDMIQTVLFHVKTNPNGIYTLNPSFTSVSSVLNPTIRSPSCPASVFVIPRSAGTTPINGSPIAVRPDYGKMFALWLLCQVPCVPARNNLSQPIYKKLIF